MGKDSPAAAPPRDLAKEISQILSQAPSLYASQAELSPQNLGLDLSNLNLALEGQAAGQRQVTVQTPVSGWINNKTGATVTQLPSQAINHNRGPAGDRQTASDWTPTTLYQPTTKMVDQPATQGLYDLLKTGTQRIGDISSQANTASRTATMADLRSLNPDQAALYDSLAADAKAGLAAGDRLTPDQIYQITNPTRSNWASRGVGSAPAAMLDESLQLFAGGNALGQQRRTNAANTAQLGSQLYTMPAMSLAPDTMGAASNFLGFGQSYGQQPSILQSLGGYGSDLFNTNFNATSANNINRANANNATTAGATTAAVTIAAAAL